MLPLEIDMSEDEQNPVGIVVFIDSLPNLIKHLPDGKETAREFLLRRFNSKMDSMIENYELLGPALLPADGFLKYLLEARDLFVEGFDYGAVALCGLVADSVCIQVAEQRVSGSEKREILESGFQARVKKIAELKKFRGSRTPELLHEIGGIRREYVHLRRPTAEHKEVLRIFQILRLVVFAEFGLVPGEGGKVVPAGPADIERLAQELGI